MTREEVKNSLEYQAGKEALKRYNTQSIDKDFDVISFEEGAEFGYNLAIDKACEWLDCYIDNYLFIDAENKAGIKWDDFINDFRKAMKGD